jgi:hypothetical protein
MTIQFSGPAAPYISLTKTGSVWSYSQVGSPPVATLDLIITETLPNYPNSPYVTTYPCTFRTEPKHETVTVDAARLVTLVMNPPPVRIASSEDQISGTFSAPFDPSDCVQYAVSFTPLLGTTKLATLEEITVSPINSTIGTLGLEVIQTGPRRPTLDADGGKIGIWVRGDPTLRQAPQFSGGGVDIAIKIRITTTSDPSTTLERTVALTVRQL